jgi:hypothetical protein
VRRTLAPADGSGSPNKIAAAIKEASSVIANASQDPFSIASTYISPFPLKAGARSTRAQRDGAANNKPKSSSVLENFSSTAARLAMPASRAKPSTSTVCPAARPFAYSAEPSINSAFRPEQRSAFFE